MGGVALSTDERIVAVAVLLVVIAFTVISLVERW